MTGLQLEVYDFTSYKLYKNGIFNSTGPMSVSTTPMRYTCSSSTARLYWSDGTSTYDRES